MRTSTLLLTLLSGGAPPLPPSQPAVDVVSTSTLTPTITWSYPVDGAVVDYYVVSIYDANGLAQQSGHLMVKTYDASALYNMTQYSVVVTAYNGAGATDSDSVLWTTDYYDVLVPFSGSSSAGSRTINGTVGSVVVVDADAILPEGSGVLQPTALTGATNSTDVRSGSSFAFSAGIMLQVRVRYESSVSHAGSAERAYFYLSGATGISSASNPVIRADNGVWELENAAATDETTANDTWYVLTIILHPTGGFDAFIDGHHFYHNRSLNSAAPALYAHLTGNNGSRLPFTVDTWIRRPLPALYQAAWWAATVNQNPPVSTTLYDMGASDGTVEVAITFANPLAGQPEVRVRMDGSGNGYGVYVDTSGNLKWVKYTGGTPGGATTLAAALVSAGDTREIYIKLNGSSVRVYTRQFSAGAWGILTLRGSFTDSSYASNTQMAFVDGGLAAGGGSVGRAVAIPRTHANYALPTGL